MTQRLAFAALLALLLAACREEDGFIGGPGGARAFVDSDPPGGRILVDNRGTGRLTPDTIRGLTGRHDITVRMDTLGTSYRYTAQLVLPNPDTTADVNGPLVVRCSTPTCYADLFQHHGVNRLRFASNPVGTFFLADGSGEGLIWPSQTNNSYASGGIPLFAALMQGDTIALGMYDTQYLAGRPVPLVVEEAGRVWVRQSTWIVPPSNLLSIATVRGVRIDESILATTTVEDAVVLKLVFHNITNDPLYQLVDPFLPPEGVTFERAYIGFALDPDIGLSTDDLLSYDADLDLVFMYDARFEEAQFTGGFANTPALVGLRMLEAPPGANIILNGWARQAPGAGDWFAGLANEGTGWGMMSGLRVYAPDHVNPRIGHMPQAAADLRMMVTAGPITLAPGDSAAITVAVVLAQPAPGTFTSGTLMDPGNPTDDTRPLVATAAPLRARAQAAAALTPAANR